ncbi:hypothetical protein FISHEDRAFT_62128 [Fistulina hepatica ATCC 64428]|nr:hypothetical protein FISHEDRAFT_62128 [Fistulina hepatica ATCC 64428]
MEFQSDCQSSPAETTISQSDVASSSSSAVITSFVDGELSSSSSFVAAAVDAHIPDGQVAKVSEERWFTFNFTWSGQPFSLGIAESDRVFDLKTALHSLTNVPPERQKILGLVKGKLPPDDVRIADLKTSGKKFTLIGTPEGDELKDPSQLAQLPDVINDLDIDFARNPAAVSAYANDIRNIRKVLEATQKVKVNIIHPLRPQKRLLVLDIDYSGLQLSFNSPKILNSEVAILDTKPLTSGSLPPRECARPGLHEFLEAVYPYYDKSCRSQTSWIWLEAKLVEIGMIGEQRNYQISFVLDKACMFTVFSQRDGKPWSHSVKALQIIWNHFPQLYMHKPFPRSLLLTSSFSNASNTIHIDDLSRNFALNPQQGLKIKAFKNAATPEAMADRELAKLAIYLRHIAQVPDFKALSHENWKSVVKSLRRNGDP